MARPLASPVQTMSPHGPSPPPGLRHRGPVRAATVAHLEPFQAQRRNSILSDTVSDARRSLRSSTDDLFFPRVPARSDRVATPDESPWQSFPLGLALLPAVAGLFFKDGSAVVTDVTLLVIAAIFLNWSVRLPWYVGAEMIPYPSSYSPPLTPPGTGITRHRPPFNSDKISTMT